MEKILEAFGEISDFLPRVDTLQTAFHDVADFQRILGLIYIDIAEFFQRTYKFFRRRAWHSWFTFHWGLFERRFKSIIERLASHCDLLDRGAAAIHFLEMRKERDARRQEDEDFERQRHSRMAQEVIRWLSAAEDNQEDYLHKLADQRHPGTCSWILGNDQVGPWIEDGHADAILWMTGIPGAGKSILSGLIVENLQTRADQTTLYYFCGQKASSGDKCASVLRTLAVQFLRQDLDMAPLVHQAHLQRGAVLSTPGMKNLLKELLGSANNTRIVLDGIDECGSSAQKDILNSLLEAQKHAGDSCRILVSSRDEPLISKALYKKPHVTLAEKTTEALDLYIKNQVEYLRNEHAPSAFDPALFERAECRLQQKAKGMFLWVRLVVTMLEQQMSEYDFEASIEQLPDGLEEAYGAILDRIRKLDRSLKDRAFKILFWLCTSYCPLKEHEVADGITLRPGQENLDRRTRITDFKKHILDVCAPIIQRSPNGTLDLVHFSAKEFLLDDQSGPFIDLTASHFSIAFSCISNLISALVLAPRYSAGTSELTIETLVVQGGLGLHCYSHAFWAEHVKAYLDRVQDLDDQAKTLISILQRFATVRKDHATNWVDWPSSEGQSTSFEARHLSRFPLLLALVRDQLHFKEQVEQMASKVDNPRELTKWKLQSDKTFLSLVASRVQEITERLLSLNPSQLPGHIDKKDYDVFAGRFGFVCRFHACTQCFESTTERDVHEGTHLPSFPCLQCDFFEGGFKSRQDLDRHTRRYHTRPEDSVIPAGLHCLRPNLQPSSGSRDRNGKTGAGSNQWNDEGHRALKESLSQVIERLQSTTLQGKIEKGTNTNGTSAREDSLISSTASLEGILANIDDGKYRTLTGFKNDIRKIPVDFQASEDMRTIDDLEMMCDHELEQALKSFPVFSSFGDESNATHKQIGRIIKTSGREDCTDDVESQPENAVLLLGPRVPYWSTSENLELPKLIRIHGRNFEAISTHLSTKTASEVEQHFLKLVKSGRSDLLSMADLADVARGSEKQPAQGQSLDHKAETVDRYSEEKYVYQSPIPRSQPPNPACFALQLQSGVSSGPSSSQGEQSQIAESSPAAEDLVSTNTACRPKYTRKKPLRVHCHLCNRHEKGLHSHEAFVKHYNRYHSPMRDAWICVDVSLEKDFLAKCKPCRTRKPYNAKHSAVSHLRKHHFINQSATIETLAKWLKKTEVENKNPEAKMRNPRNLPKVQGVLSPSTMDNNVRPLPSISDLEKDYAFGDFSTLGGLGSQGSQSLDTNNDFFFQDVSFSNVLPGGSADLAQEHISNRSLIRLEHIPKLPHLDEFKKAVCHDQVSALYETLNSKSPYTAEYQQAEERLTALSRSLMNSLREWRGSQNPLVGRLHLKAFASPA